ncbi:phosphoribosylamine--glycine ligase [Oceanobacillus neutriphilus]|uniref:Phosphoribosylamine--glycine ligase n=1 Tax=Oceanobacillus neutriphilus TaxID=531815 RepID=A0ABQ2NTJ7_9BACI|nr:phosphoribosylamine--glycine ligase [Oceanobacillus neutriphilus]GGP08046.1 phosphoribosylamine--glycine ligase [Oceanobacillus neutriphilus]
MKILVVGRGGREHSIVKKLKENQQLKKIYAAPGNAGMEEDAECIPIDEMNIEELAAFAKEAKVDLTIVGPENPLNAGIANHFHQENLAIFAPSKEAAWLEGSKSYAKDFMKKYDIPTASYGVFQDAVQAKKRIAETGAPIVIKADGLAAGKGVIVAMTEEEANQAIDNMLVDKAFDQAGSTVVIEEYLEGAEFSLMAFVHEDKVYPMMAARDHKRAFDNDEGPNTGGMGAFAPIPDLTEEAFEFSVEQILKKTAEGMIKEGRPFTGILYAGLMLTKNGPKVIEFNTRFGDPETQVVLPLLKNDLVQVMQDVLAKKNPKLEWHKEACVGVVLASEGYPGQYSKGNPLPHFDDEDTYIIHAGTKKAPEAFVSDGGRVLLVGGRAETLTQAAAKVYQQLDKAELNGNFFYRSDIAK